MKQLAKNSGPAHGFDAPSGKAQTRNAPKRMNVTKKTVPRILGHKDAAYKIPTMMPAKIKTSMTDTVGIIRPIEVRRVRARHPSTTLARPSRTKNKNQQRTRQMLPIAGTTTANKHVLGLSCSAKVAWNTA